MIPNFQDAQGQETEAKRVKSGIGFPYGDLSDAVGVVQKIFENRGQQYCTVDQLAAWLGHESMTSGAFRLKLSTARLFGLIEVDGDNIKLTALGCDIIDVAHERQARVEAFLTVPLYKKLYENYRGRNLPPDVGLEQEMAELGVPPKQKEKARQAFQRSASQAGFFEQGRSRLVLPSGTTTPGNILPHDSTTRQLAPPPPSTPFTPPHREYGGGNSGGGNSGNELSILDEPLVRGLIQLLPEAKAVWSDSERKKWFALAESIFNAIYRSGDNYANGGSQ